MKVARGVTYDTDDDDVFRMMMCDTMRVISEDPRGVVPWTTVVHHTGGNRPEYETVWTYETERDG